MQPCSGFITSSSAYLASSVNPHVLNGAMVAGPANGDYVDARTNLDNTVSIELNSAFAGALGVLAAGNWGVCSRRDGLLDQTGHHILRI